VPGDFHELSHEIVGAPPDAPAKQKMTTVYKWMSSRTADFVDQLKAVVLPDGSTLFDSTVVVGTSEISYDHKWTDTPFYILAGQQTPFNTGRFVSFPTQVTHTHLLVTLLNAFGINVTSFGDPRLPPGNLNAELLR